MVINLRQLYETEGEKTDIDAEISPERLSEIHGYSFIGSVGLKGIVVNRAGVVQLNYGAQLKIGAVCDRCLRELEKEFSFDFEHILVRNVDNGCDEYIVTENDCLEPDELAVSDILLQMPTKLLCKEDCKGLCPKCGADLNVSDCGCQNSPV